MVKKTTKNQESKKKNNSSNYYLHRLNFHLINNDTLILITLNYSYCRKKKLKERYRM